MILNWIFLSVQFWNASATTIKNVNISLTFVEIFIIQRYVPGKGINPNLMRLVYSNTSQSKVYFLVNQ